jgi:hypothetical protein
MGGRKQGHENKEHVQKGKDVEEELKTINYGVMGGRRL